MTNNNSNEINEIVQTLQSAKTAYYEGKPFMSDAEFDELEYKLELIDPDNEYFNQVGYQMKDEENTVQHTVPMLSIRNLKPNEDIISWYKRCKLPETTILISEPKIDGISGSLTYHDGKLIYGATRGDGFKGHKIEFINKKRNKLNSTILKEISQKGIVEVRGEFYIPKSIGEKYFKDKPLRNVCSGFIKSGENTQFVYFIAYQIITDEFPIYSETDCLSKLIEFGFNTVPHGIIRHPEDVVKLINDYIVNLRDKYDYETDGIVLMVNDKDLQRQINSSRVIRSYNHHNIAIKPPSKIYKSKLIGIEVNVSKSGRLIPVMIYEPIMINNVEFERATMNNYEYLKSFGELYYGNTVYVTRTMEVIPKIVGMEHNGDKTKPILFPEDKCPSCGKSVIRIDKHLVCKNPRCTGKSIAQIYNWVDKRNMKNIGIKFLEAAYEKGIIRSIPDLYDPNLERKLPRLDRFVDGGGKIRRIMDSINKSKEDVTDLDILSAIGIPGIGRVVLENLNLTNIDTLPKDVTSRKSDLAVYGYISEWLSIPNNFKMLLKLKELLNSKSYNIDRDKKTVVVTGTFSIPRNELKKILERKGYTILNNVTSKTDYLVVGSNAGSKLEKAKNLGKVKIVDIKEII